MAMAVDSRQHLGNMPYDPLRYNPQPSFTNPWVSAPGAASQAYATSMPHTSVAGDRTQTPNVSMAYASQPLPAMSMPSDYAPRPYGTAYPAVSAATSASAYSAPTSAPQYTTDYTHTKPAAYSMVDSRPAHPSVHTSLFGDSLEANRNPSAQRTLVDFDRLSSATDSERQSFNDALDASRGMVAMSQDITPRNIYGGQASARTSSDSYGFPSTHSAHSSISSASTYPTYYNSSVSESSYGDYSSASESVDMPSRTLPRPTGLIAGQLPPAPQSMMGQFSSKVSSSSQKKHKCKICDKRFTRPSSLQTHMYSHTGEKPFACDVDGCGRHFSVVSNLRRHRKVHKGESDHPSPDDD